MVTKAGMFVSLGLIFVVVGIFDFFQQAAFSPLAFGITLLVTAFFTDKEPTQ